MSYKKEVLAYKWFVCDIKAKRAVSGFEIEADAKDLLNDFDDVKNYKVISKSRLATAGIVDPTAKWIAK